MATFVNEEVNEGGVIVVYTYYDVVEEGFLGPVRVSWIFHFGVCSDSIGVCSVSTEVCLKAFLGRYG